MAHEDTFENMLKFHDLEIWIFFNPNQEFLKWNSSLVKCPSLVVRLFFDAYVMTSILQLYFVVYRFFNFANGMLAVLYQNVKVHVFHLEDRRYDHFTNMYSFHQSTLWYTSVTKGQIGLWMDFFGDEGLYTTL